MKVGVGAFLLLLGLVVSGCGSAKKSASNSQTVAFLKWSMDQNAAFKTYRSSCDWSMGFGMGDSQSTRQIAFVKPNKFKIVSDNHGYAMTSVSNGSKLLEYTSSTELPGESYESPTSIAAASSMQMKHPMFCGTLLYKFFGGASSYDELVDSDKGDVTFGAEEKAPNGEDARVVKFYAKDTYGNTEVLIGKKTGLVYRIVYDDDGLRQLMKEHPELGGGQAADIKLTTTEKYRDIKTDDTIADTEFDMTLPKGITVTEAGGEQKPPVQLGKPAPDFEVTDLSGKKTRLSSLKGKVVLIDFWATWCGPCRESLPTTDKMHRQYADKGLQVMTISDEAPDKIAAFVKEQGYAFPVFVDGKNEANKAYGIESIPTLAIVDAQGNLSSYSVGLEGEDKVIENLRKAGLKI